jgi:hypothetical protein
MSTRPSGGRRKPGFAVTDDPGIGLDPNEAAISNVVEPMVLIFAIFT